jgi:hypothetical protein
VLIVGGLIAFVATRGGDDGDEPSAAAQTPEATATPTGTASANANDIILQGVKGSKAAGLMRLLPRDDGTVQFGIAAQDLPPNKGRREFYAVWFTRTGAPPRRLGFAQEQVGQDGILTTTGPQKSDEDEFPRWFATYEKVLITRETNAAAKKPGPTVLEGALPGSS